MNSHSSSQRPDIEGQDLIQGQHLTDCIKACAECHDLCQKMIYQHCLRQGGHHIEPDHLRLMADCAQTCRMAADFMLRASPRHVMACRLCAEISEACADDCERLGDMVECMQACRLCAELCREMAGAAV